MWINRAPIFPTHKIVKNLSAYIPETEKDRVAFTSHSTGANENEDAWNAAYSLEVQEVTNTYLMYKSDSVTLWFAYT